VPHLSATVLSLSQDMDLNTGSMANFMFLRLPDGTTIRALIGDEAAQDIIRLSIGQNGATIPAPPLEVEETPESEAHVFGGADPMPPEDAPVERPPPKPHKRPKRVDKDELGYPVVHMEGGVDPSELTGGRDRDEDGIGQI
jgi:hypothetical protein